MKVYAIIMIFVMMFSIASFALAESGSSNNETDDSDLNETDDSGNDSESDLDDSDEDTNETELDDETDDDSDKNGTRENSRNEFKEDRDELREEYRYEFRNATSGERYEIRMKFKEEYGELKEEYKIKVRGENVTFNYTDDDKLQFMVNKINARTGLNLTLEDLENVSLGQVLRAYLSNGRWAEVKVMPDSASERALERLGAKCEERNCTIELKEVGKNGTNSTKLVYEIESEKESRMFGVFKNKMKVKAEVDAETGEVIFTKKPWWAFLASEKDESDDDNEDSDDDSDEDTNETELDDDSNQTIGNSSN